MSKLVKTIEAKLSAQQEELERREAAVVEEEQKLGHLRQWFDELRGQAAAIAKREDAMAAAEMRLAVTRRESVVSSALFEGSVSNKQPRPFAIIGSPSPGTGTTVGPPAGDGAAAIIDEEAAAMAAREAAIQALAHTVDMQIAATMAQLQRREDTLASLEENMLAERRKLNTAQDEHHEATRAAAAAAQVQKEQLRKEREALTSDQLAFAAQQADSKGRDEERDLFNKLIHDLELADERTRKHLKSVEDDLEAKKLRLELERDEVSALKHLLETQAAEHREAHEALEQERRQLAAERANLVGMRQDLAEREQQLAERQEAAVALEKKVAFDRQKLSVERDALAVEAARDAELRHEARVDAQRANAAAEKTASLRKAMGSLHGDLVSKEDYLRDWETELSNREDVYARMVEQSVSVPKLHQASQEYQDVSSGVTVLQMRRLKEHYIVGQQRRVRSATAQRCGPQATSTKSSARPLRANPYPSGSRPNTPAAEAHSTMLNDVSAASAPPPPLQPVDTAAGLDIPPAGRATPMSPAMLDVSALRPMSAASSRLRPMSASVAGTDRTAGGGAPQDGKASRFHASMKHSHAATSAALAGASRVASLTKHVTELQRTFIRHAARANLLAMERDETATERYYGRLSARERTDVELAIWSERVAAQSTGLRFCFNNCPVQTCFEVPPHEFVKRVSKWWVDVDEQLQHGDERRLQERMDVLDRAIEALRKAEEKTDDGASHPNARQGLSHAGTPGTSAVRALLLLDEGGDTTASHHSGASPSSTAVGGGGGNSRGGPGRLHPRPLSALR